MLKLTHFKFNYLIFVLLFFKPSGINLFCLNLKDMIILLILKFSLCNLNYGIILICAKNYLNFKRMNYYYRHFFMAFK